MASGRFVSYLRVSTQRQGESGLGLEAQREAVRRFLNGGAWELAGEHVEVESGRKANRPQLAAALAECKRSGSTLIVAKLDRLARDARALLSLVDSGVPLRFVDLPDVPAGAVGRLLLTQMAAVAEFEGRRISERTRDALAAAKARGVQLGKAGPANLKPNIEQRQAAADAFSEKLRPVLLALLAKGLTHRAIVAELNALGIASPRGGRWHLPTLARTLARINPEERVQAAAADLTSGGATARSVVEQLARRRVFRAKPAPMGA